ncbi:LOW QUALITY PROTEIN: chondroadherin-like protein [Sylvia borin]
MVSLCLQRCSIGHLHPGELQGLESLVYLYLTDNHLSTLVAAAFEGVPQLAYLDLDLDQNTRVPAGTFRLLPNLISLHLQHNVIGEREGNLAGARELRWLCLTGNTIRHIAPAALAPTKVLEKLQLEGNHLLEVPTAALQGLPPLSELKLSQNLIEHMGDSVFLLAASSLQHLYLDNMGLEWISPHAFTGLGAKIRSLYLESNKMPNIPNMSNFTRLEILNLQDVPFHCDCHLLLLCRWINKLNLCVGTTCRSPAEAMGLKVKLSTFQICPGWGQGEAGETNPKKTKAARKPSKKKRSGKSPARGFSKSRA